MIARRKRLGFVTEGHFVALPLAVPHESLPIPPDASRITALALSADGRRVYGATGGTACHVFISIQKGASGTILDLGTLPVDHIPAIAECSYRTRKSTEIRLVVLGETEAGIMIHTVAFYQPGNTIQEPFYAVPDIRSAGCLDGWHGATGIAVVDRRLVCLSRDGVAVLSRGTTKCLKRVALAGPAPVTAPIATGDGTIAWLAADGTIHRYRYADGLLPPSPATGPAGAPVTCSALHDTTLITAGVDGTICSHDLTSGTRTRVGRVAPLPVQCLTVRPDGVIYGICGEGIGHLFRLRPDGTLADLGVIASVIGAIRHGFEFACALATPEGIIYLGEHDRGGHLWMYFPSYGTLD